MSRFQPQVYYILREILTRKHHVPDSLALAQAGQIVDDELNQLLVNPLPPGVRLHAIIDACHSGSMLDLEVQAECKNGDSHWRNEYKKRPKRYKVTAGLFFGSQLSLHAMQGLVCVEAQAERKHGDSHWHKGGGKNEKKKNAPSATR